MRKETKHKIFVVVKRVMIASLVIALFFTLPLIKLNGEDLSMIYGTFIGNKSKYQGIIEVWNIDTFESGSISKTSFITSVAKTYQNKNKGLFIMVRNMTEQECLNLLEAGEMPDLFSCSYGVAEKLKNYVQPFGETSKNIIRSDFENAGYYNGKLYGLAWCRGCYFLISTKEKLEKAKIDVESGVKLSDIALNSGYVIEKKNSTKIVYSLDFGMGIYGIPQMALKTYNIIGEPSKIETSINAETISGSSFGAYSKFVAGESVILLGTQRDVVRMENKVETQKVVDVVYQPLSKFTDLVQFFMLGKVDNSLRNFYAEDFAKFMTSSEVQRKLASANIFPVITAFSGDYKYGIMKDIIPEINEICETLNIFISKEGIDGLRG